MAARFWVLGAGTWDNSNTANWSATSGGAGGASAPTSADDVTFDLNSGTGVVTTASSAAANSVTYNSNTLTELLFGDNLDISASTSGAFTLTAGTIDLAGFTLTVKSFSSSNSNTRAIQFGTGNITTTGSGTAWTTATATNLTYTGTPTVNISNNSATATTVTAHTTNGTESNSFDFNFTTGTYTLTLTTGARVKNLDFTGFTGTWSPGTSTCQIFGNFTLSSGMTFTNGSGVFTFSATSGVQLITSAGKTLSSITQNGVGGTVRLASGTTTLGTARTYTFSEGTLDLSTNTATLATGQFSSSTTSTRAIQFGTGNITTTGTGLVWTTSDATNLTYTGTPTVNISNSGASTLSMNVHITNGSATNSFDFNFTTGTHTLSIGSGSRFRSLNFTGFAGSWSPGGNSFTFYGSLTFVSGMTFTTGTGTFTFSASSGTQIITSAGKTLSSITHNVAGTTLQLNGNLTCSSTFTNSGGITDLNGFDLTCGTFVCSNTTPVKAIYFGTNQISMTGNNTTVLNITSTNFSFTGTMKFVSTYTGSVGTRTFTATATSLATSITAGAGPGFQLSFGTTATDIVTFTGQLASLDFTGYTRTWSWGTLGLYGDLTLDTGMTVTTGTGILTLSATSGTQIITSAGKTLGSITQNTPGATVQLASDTTLGSTRTYTLDRGTLNLNNFILTTGLFSSSTSNTRAIQFGTGNITVNGSSGTICQFDQLSNYTHTGSAIINVSNNSASAVTIGIATSGSSELNTPNVNVNTGTYALTINNASKFLSLNFTGFTGTWSPGNNNYTFYRDVTLSSGMTYNTGTTSWTFSGLASTTAYLTSAGKTIYSIIFTGLGTTNRTLVDPLTVSDSVTLTLGTLDANNQNVTVGSFTSNSGSVRALIMGSGTWTLTGATTTNVWNVSSSNLTFNKGTANIDVGVTSSGAAVTFAGGGLTYNNLSLTQPSVPGTLSINGANTFNTFTSNKTVSYKLNLVNGLTNTFTTFVCNGSLGKIFAINSTSPGNAAGLSVTNSFTADYVAITDVSLTSLNGVVTNGYLQYTTAPVYGWTLGTGSQYYRALTSGTLWQVPAGFSSPNIVHILGGGGGGSGGSIASVTSTRAGGAGGGGGGYAQLVNQSYTAGSGIGYSIGSAGSAGSGATGGGTSTGGTGGTTSWGALQNTITFVAAELSVQNTSSTSITVTVPAGVSNGDLMLMMVTSASSPSWTTPSGWTLGGSGSQGRALFYRTASSEPANYVVTGSVSSTHDAYIVAYANATYDKQAGITLSSLSNPTTPAAITLATPNSTVLVVTKSTSGSVTFTTPTGYTVVSSDSDSTGPSTAVFSASISAAGTYTAPSSTLSSGSGYSYIVALSPTLGSYSTTASGGTGGVSAGGLTSTAGTGGTGSGGSTNYTGGTGGIGGNTTTVSVATGGGGGAGGAGPNGNGGNGGNGLANSLMAGGGGGGNGGGSAGANSTVANTGGNGGNNSLGVGGGTSSTSAFQGGGGVGGSGGGGGNGSAGDEIITVAGSGGGGGGSGSAGAGAAAAGNYGAGGSGGSVSTTPTASSGGAGTQGLVLIIWTFTSGGFTANITENSSLADVLSILASYNVSQTEDSTLTENQNISAQFAASQTENSNLDDTTTQQANYIQSFTENVNIDDLKTVVAQFINSVTEAVTVDDIEQASLIFIDSISENLTAESIESIQATFVSLITENINAADLNSVKMDYLVAVFENAGLLDIICYNGWFKIDTNQSSAWSNVNDSQSAGWGSINTNQTANWNNIDPEQPCS